jgi:class 3 adenylate cyclase/tetratricopeptide (TPR) repeat protein
MEVRLLGLVEAGVDGRAIALGAAKQRAVLAMLALRANTSVSLDQLIEGLWGETPPRSAPKMVQLYVSRLRRLFDGAGAKIVTRGRGYELRLAQECVDALRFERLVAAAEGSDNGVGGAAREALALWRGPALDDLADEPFAAAEIRRLDELWVRARELAIDDALATGEHAAVVGELQELVAQHPLRERLHAQRMLALYRCGRQAEALEAYRQARAVLVGEVGVEPGPELRQLQEAILSQDRDLDLPAPPVRRQVEAEADGDSAQALEEPPAAPAVELPEPLAKKARRAAQSLEDERKQATVLFCDIQGSMELAESLDPELWRNVLDRFLALVSEAVHSYEGTVNRFTGDGAMALFGAPIAHEDHALRACHAALRLRDALAQYGQQLRAEHGLEFAVRLGLNSGEVVVGAVGEDLQMEYTAIGHTVGLAARMQEAAEPGKPCLTQQTAALVEGYFKLEDLGDLQVKGARQPVHAYGLTGTATARTRLDAAAGRGLSPLVGRDRELAALEAALDRAGETGQVVGVVAEPGVGKSRLCREFADACRARGMRVTVGGGVAHGRRVPLLPVIELLRAHFGITEDDDPQEARAKVAPLLDEDFGQLLPVLFDFLGVPDPERPVPAQMDPEARRRALFAATRRLIETPAEEDPGLLVVEDLHWLDPGSEAFLGNLVEALPGTRALLLVTFRPEYQSGWMRRSFYEQLALGPLERDQTAQLFQVLAGTGPSLGGLAELVAERTGGNPFFIEEVVQGLAETGVLEGDRGDYRLAHPIDEIEIPASIHALLAARIDRLSGNEKTVLQSAAVIGREFSESLLRRVTGLPEHQMATALDALAGAELVFQRALYPEARYAFRHPLSHEVAYRSQLRTRRARMHSAAAEALEALHSDRQDELAGLISHHWERANEPLGAAKWGARAAAWAGRSNPGDALRHWRHVRALLHDQRSSPEATGLALGACVSILFLVARLGQTADNEVEEIYREGRGLAAATADQSALAMVHGAYAMTRGMTGRLEQAIAVTREAKVLAGQSRNLELEVSINSGLWLAVAGRNREALVEFDRLLEAAGDDFQLGREFGVSAVIFGTVQRGRALIELGRLREARAALERAGRQAREHEDLESLGFACASLGHLAFFSCEPADGLALACEAVDLAERLGSPMSRVAAHGGLGSAHLAREEYNEAIAAARDALEIARAAGIGLQYEAVQHSTIANSLLGLEDVAEAEAAARQGAASAAALGARVQEAWCRCTLGRTLLRRRPDAARLELERACELAGEDGPFVVPHVVLGLADLAGLQGDDGERLRRLEGAHRLFQQQGATGHARHVAAQIAAARP